jgi:hypothetical protein
MRRRKAAIIDKLVCWADEDDIICIHSRRCLVVPPRSVPHLMVAVHQRALFPKIRVGHHEVARSTRVAAHRSVD